VSYLRFLENSLTILPSLTTVSTVSASRNFALTDVGLFLVATGASPITLTLNVDNWRQSTELYLAHNSDAIVSIVADSGVTITRFGGASHQLAGKGAIGTLKLISTNTWLLFGDFF
jgi:hypothetical protein